MQIDESNCFIGGSNGTALDKLVRRMLSDYCIVTITPPKTRNTDPKLFIFDRTAKDGHKIWCEVKAWSLGSLVDALKSLETKLSNRVMDIYVRRSKGETVWYDLDSVVDDYVFAHELRCRLEHSYSEIKFEMERRLDKELTAIENEYGIKLEAEGCVREGE